jgi:hypothetical protein
MPQRRIAQGRALEQFTQQYEKALCYSFSFQRLNSSAVVLDDIEEVSLVYEIIAEQSDIAHVRKITAGFIDIFTHMINTDKAMQSYLHERPFPKERFTLALVLTKQLGSPQRDDDVTFLIFRSNIICYCHYNPIDHSNICLYRETYEDARRILEQKDQEVEVNHKEPSIRSYSLTETTEIF